MSVRRLDADDVAQWVLAELTDPERVRPVVVVTSARDGYWPLDPDRIAARLADAADVVALETGPPTRVLAGVLPPMLEIYGGSARVYWPGFDSDADPYEHPILWAKTETGRQESDLLGLFRHLLRTPPPAGAAPPTAPQTAERLRDLEVDLVRAREEARSHSIRARDAEREVKRLQATLGERDATASEIELEAAIWATYARLYRASDRDTYPLGRFRFAAGFLPSIQDLQGIAAERIVTACTHVAADRAHEIAAYEVRQLRDGAKGPPRVREDGAAAWRLSLQQGTPAARRMHYWVGSDPSGARTVEFEVCGTHDAHL